MLLWPLLPLLQPLEALNPILQNPAMGSRPLWVEALIKLKPLLMSIYFGADHVVWAQQVRLLTLFAPAVLFMWPETAVF